LHALYNFQYTYKLNAMSLYLTFSPAEGYGCVQCKQTVGFIGNLPGTLQNLTLKNCTVTSTDGEAGMLVGNGWGSSMYHCRVLGGTVTAPYAAAIANTFYPTDASDNLYTQTVTVVSDGVTRKPGKCGTSYGDNGSDDAAVLVIALADNASNSALIETWAGNNDHNVMLLDRKLWKDGDWNTLCLPFGISDFDGTIFADADSLSGVKPDSALRLLQQQEESVPHWSKAQRMRHALLTAKAMNKAYVPLTSDSLMTVVAAYYDSHGTPNDQMEAHYLLGCTYRDLGEAPAALAAYQDAIDRADTLAADCDLHILMAVHGQMAEMYHSQGLTNDEKKMMEEYGKIALSAGDTMAYIRSVELLSKVYDMRKDTMAMLDCIHQAMSLYKQHGHHKSAVQALPTPIYIAVIRGETDSAYNMMQVFETESGLFDEQGNIAPFHESYYYIKGSYYMSLQRMDSAEYYFRKLLRCGHEADGHRGLLEVYANLGRADSTAHHALLFEQAIDQQVNDRETEAVKQVAALYDYQRHEQLARQSEMKATRMKFYITILALTIILLSVWISSYYKEQKRKAEILMERYRRNVEELSYLKGKLQKLTDTVCDKDATIHEQEAAIESLSEIIARKEEELAASLSELSNNHNALFLQKRETDETKRKLTASPAYQLLQDKDRRGDKLEAEDWEDIAQLVEQTFPIFYDFVTARGNGTNTKEQQLCLLFRLYVKPRRASLLIGVAPSMVTKLSKSVLQKLFNTDGTGKDLAERLQMLR